MSDKIEFQLEEIDENNENADIQIEESSYKKAEESTVASDVVIENITEEEITNESVELDFDSIDNNEEEVQEEPEETTTPPLTDEKDEDEAVEEVKETVEINSKLEEVQRELAIAKAELEIQTYSKEETVAPNISKYDYGMYSLEVTKNGSLSDESYEALAEKGYSKDYVDNFITNKKIEIDAASQEVDKGGDVVETPTQEQIQEQNINEAAKALDMDTDGFKELFSNATKAFTQAEKDEFNKSSPMKQTVMLAEFKKNSENKIIRGKTYVNNPPKTNDDALSLRQMQKNYDKAKMSGDSAKINYWSDKIIDNHGFNF